MRSRFGTVVTLIALVAASCSGSDSGSAETTSTASATSTAVVPAEQSRPTVVAEAESDGVVLLPPEPTTNRMVMVTTTGPVTGGRPELGWQPVEGAVRYEVVLFAPDGSGYWAWQGSATSVHVGGEPQLNADAAGPSATVGMTWQVLAVDGSNQIIGASGRAVVEP